MYDLSFYWAGIELFNRTGYQSIQVTGSLGGDAFDTPAYLNTAPAGEPGSFSGWTLANFTFTANASSELLSFLAVGTPAGNLPPFALLDGVSLTAVPEASTWAMMLVGSAVSAMPHFAAAGPLWPSHKGKSRNRGFLIRGGIRIPPGFSL